MLVKIGLAVSSIGIFVGLVGCYTANNKLRYWGAGIDLLGALLLIAAIISKDDLTVGG